MLVQESYNARQSGPNPTGKLGLSNSVVATEYLCQVPRRKAVGDILVSVLLADLVFLQFAWKLYTLLVDKLLTHGQSDAMFCQACAEREDEESEAIHNPSLAARYHTKAGVASSTFTVVDKGTGVIRTVRDGSF